MNRRLCACTRSKGLFLCVGISLILLLAYTPSVSAEVYYFVMVKHSGKCLHQHGATFGNGDPITQWDCVHESNVYLQKVPAGGDAFFLKFAHSGKCVHLHGDSSANGAQITQWDCIDLPNVKWREVPAAGSYVYLTSQSTNKCLHQHGATFGNGDPITQWDCVDEPNVQWIFVPACVRTTRCNDDPASPDPRCQICYRDNCDGTGSVWHTC